MELLPLGRYPRPHRAGLPLIPLSQEWGPLLFCDTIAGAKASASLFSLIETAKANGLEPHAYLSALIEKLPTLTTVEDFEAWLPWNVRDAQRLAR